VRLFVAIEIPDVVRETIAELARELKVLDDFWRWPRAENLHVTLKFLGEIPQEKLKSICESLRGVPCEWPIRIKFGRLGFFPNEHRPRVLWLGVEAPPALSGMAAAIEDALAGAGLPREERPFTPHLTLARSKDGKLSEKLRAAMAKHFSASFGEMNASAFRLIESKLKSTGAEYTTLESFPGARQS
jgi:2'-5' RNA ligase